MARALLYVRVSSDEQAESGFSLPDQREKLAAYAQQHGLEIVANIADDFTGRSLDRPGLEQVTELAKRRAFDVLVCAKLDRLARINHLRRGYEEFLADCGISVVFLDQHFEPTPAGRLQRGILGEFAEYESEVIRERTMGGRVKKARGGTVPVSYPLYGYKQVTKAEAAVMPEWAGRAGELVVIEQEAGVVRRAYALYIAGESIRGIVRLFNAEGLRTRKGCLWTPGTIRRLLQNEAYAGIAWFGRASESFTREKTAGGHPRRQRVNRPREEWIGVPVSAVVERSLWEVVQRQFAVNTDQLKGRPNRDWLLKGLIYCSECRTTAGGYLRCSGSDIPLTRNRLLSQKRYRCGSAARTGTRPDCGIDCPAGRAEKAALDAMTRACDPTFLAEVARLAAEEQQRAAGFPEQEIGEVAAQLEKLKAEEMRLADLVLAGFGADVVGEKVADLSRRRQQLSQQLSAARGRRALETTGQAEERGREWALWLQAKWTDAGSDLVKRRALLRIFVEVYIRRRAAPVVKVKVPMQAPPAV